MPEVVIDPEIPGPARLELAKAPVTALLSFGDLVAQPGVPGRPGRSKDARTTTMTVAQVAAGGSLALAVLQCCLGLLSRCPPGAHGGIFIWLPARSSAP